MSWGGGTLTQAGKTYQLKIEGLSVGSVGITKASAWGKVFHQKKLSDINGISVAIGTAATVGGGGAAIAMKNAKGVIIDLYTTTEGGRLTLGTAGVNVELRQLGELAHDVRQYQVAFTRGPLRRPPTMFVLRYRSMNVPYSVRPEQSKPVLRYRR